jgi:predicted nucleic acid-binding protein
MISVLDCSFCAALFLPHERSAEVKETFRRLGEDVEVYVPFRFWDEMSELLAAALNRERLRYSDSVEIIRLLELYRFSTDISFGADHAGRIIDLSRLYNLNPGNASYLELAVRKKASIGTLNGALRTACIKAGVETL